MDISCQFEKIRIFLAYDRLVTILEKVAMPFVPKIEIDYITSQQLFHASGKGFATSPQQQMKEVGKSAQA